jgi:hypothetical protein
MSGWKAQAAFMAGLVIVLGTIAILVGERIGINLGQGWDGQAYMAWSLDFGKQVIDSGLTRYYAQRVLPSAIVWLVARALGIAPTIPDHLRVFQAVNLAMLAGAAVLWAHLATAVMRWRRAAAWLGFVALFASFANAKHALYYPALTDSTAFFLGMLLVWGYLAKKPVAVWLAAAAAAWTWPALQLLAMLALVLPRPAEPVAPLDGKWLRWLAAGLAAGGAALMLLVARAYYLAPVPGIGCDKFASWVLHDLLWLTVPLLAAMLVVGGYCIAAQPRAWNVIAYARTLRWPRVVIAVCACGVIVVVNHLWVNAIGVNGDGPTFGNQILCEQGNAMLRGPVWGPVHHVVYFGPIVIVAMFAWRRVCAVAAEWGPVIPLALVMILAFGVGSQTRQWIHLFPLLVALAIAATHELWTPRRAACFVVLALAWSKLWFHIGFDQVHHWFDFPDQRYYMNLGPWASDTSYLIHLVAAVVTAVTIAFLTWWGRRASKGHEQTA